MRGFGLIGMYSSSSSSSSSFSSSCLKFSLFCLLLLLLFAPQPSQTKSLGGDTGSVGIDGSDSGISVGGGDVGGGGGGGPVIPSDSQCASINVTRRLDCGYMGISADLCRQRGCCHDPVQAQHHAARLLADPPTSLEEWAAADHEAHSAPSCFYGGEGVPIRTVHVIQSNHFDAGYAKLSVDILNEYFDSYFPRAAQVGAQLRAAVPAAGGGGGDGGDQKRLRWMTQSYIVSLYLDCPLGYGLHCPNSSAVATFEAAVRAGDITWQAFPHNAELALMNQWSIRAGINLTHSLDARFGLAPKRTLSQRDVPGMPLGAVPHLAAGGITGVSEGSNGRVFPVNVAPAFVWRHKTSGKDLLALWHAYGYGTLPAKGGGPGSPARATLAVPGLDEALVYLWRGDNAGPPMDVNEVAADWAAVREIYPNAQNIVASTLDNFTAALARVKHVLPVESRDLGDSWVMGAPSDPIKMQKARALNRVAQACNAGGGGIGRDEIGGKKNNYTNYNNYYPKPDSSSSENDFDNSNNNTNRGAASSSSCGAPTASLLNFTRQVLKNGEHTFGLHVNSYGPWLKIGYPNAGFHSRVASNNTKEYTTLAYSWTEQRRWGLEYPMQAIANTEFGARAEAALEACDADPHAPVTLGLKPVAVGSEVQLAGGWFATVGPHGGLIGLRSSSSSSSSSSATNVAVNHLKNNKNNKNNKNKRSSSNSSDTADVFSAAASGTVLASPDHPLARLTYQTLTDDDFKRELRDAYLRAGSGGETEYGRPGCDASQGAFSAYSMPTLAGAWLAPDGSYLLTRSVFADAQHIDQGAPADAWLNVSVVPAAASDSATLASAAAAMTTTTTTTTTTTSSSSSSSSLQQTRKDSTTLSHRLELTLTLSNKTSTRYAEAMYLTFNPVGNTRGLAPGVWSMDKLGTPVDPVADVVPGAGRSLHAVSSGLTFSPTNLTIGTVDAPVVRWGSTLYPFPTPLVDAPNVTTGAHFMLYGNAWNTNYPFWYPFYGAKESHKGLGLSADIKFRFSLQLGL
eukprot:UC1_evm7s1611